LASVPPVYGITRPASTWNPIKINFQHVGLLIQDAWRATNWKDKFTIWFKPTGWRPEGFEEKYPVAKITNPYNFKKYETVLGKNAMIWVWFQFIFTLVFLIMLYANIGKLNFPQMLSFGAFIILNIYAYSEFMDNNSNAIIFELVKNILGLSVILFSDFWEPMYAQPIFLKSFLIIYFIGASCITLYFNKPQITLDKRNTFQNT